MSERSPFWILVLDYGNIAEPVGLTDFAARGGFAIESPNWRVNEWTRSVARRALGAGREG